MKDQCHPHHTIDDNGEWAQVDLQTVCNQTAARLLTDPRVHKFITWLKSISKNGKVSLFLSYKTGMDASANHPVAKQGKAMKDPGSHCMSSVFVFLKLTGVANGSETEYEIVENPLHNSAFACTPLRLSYEKETPGILLRIFPLFFSNCLNFRA